MRAKGYTVIESRGVTRDRARHGSHDVPLPPREGGGGGGGTSRAAAVVGQLA